MYDVGMKGFKNAPNPKKEKRPILLEVLVSIAVLAVVGGVVYMILNPQKNEEDLRNSMRSQNVVEIARAVKSYVDTTGNLLDMIPLNRECASIGNEICKESSIDCKGYIDISALVDEGYLSEIPVDDLRTSGNGTGYYISHDGDGNLLVCAPYAERGVDISLKVFVY